MDETSEAEALALAIIRLYGKKDALNLAIQLAADFEARGNAIGQKKWTNAAAWMAELISSEGMREPNNA
jgi:hypothetical protein